MTVVELTTAPLSGCRLVLHSSLDAVRERWLETLAVGCGSVFQTWDWNAAWYEKIGRHQKVAPRVVELRDRTDRTVILWPLGLYQRHGLRALDFMGDVVTDYRAPLFTAGFPSHDDSAAFEDLWHAVVRLAGPADVVDLKRMPAVLDGVPNPMVKLSRAQHTENAYSMRLPATIQELHAGQSANRRATNRRKLRRLAELGEIKIEHDHPDPTRDAATLMMAEQKSRRWRDTHSRDWFAEPGYLDFYRGLTFSHTPQARINVATMMVGDDSVATHWGLIFRGRYYWILPTYAADPWARYSCGRLLLQAMVEWSIDQGHEVFDLTVGDEAYKQDWVSDPAPLFSWRTALSTRGRFWLARQYLREWARRQPWLRRAVRWWRGKWLNAPVAND